MGAERGARWPAMGGHEGTFAVWRDTWRESKRQLRKLEQRTAGGSRRGAVAVATAGSQRHESVVSVIADDEDEDDDDDSDEDDHREQMQRLGGGKGAAGLPKRERELYAKQAGTRVQTTDYRVVD